MAIVILALVLAAMLGAAPPGREERTPEREAIAGLARVAPPAIQADALLQVAASIRFPGEWRRELLRDAFQLAAQAPQPYPMRLIPGISQSGPATLKGRRYSYGLDQLSLQMRAVQLMFWVDRDPDVLDQLPRPQFKRCECRDAMVPDVSSYYRGLMMSGHAFRPEDRKKQRDIAFYDSVLRSVQSPVEIAPAAQMIAGMPLSAAQTARLVESLGSAIAGLHADDRTFSAALYALPGEMTRFIAAVKQRGVETEAFSQTVREYVLRHLRARRCADTASDTALLARVAAAFGLQPEDLEPLEVAESADLGLDQEPAILGELRSEWQALEFEAAMRKDDLGRAHRLEQFTTKLAEWQAEKDQDEAEFLGLKQAMFESALTGLRDTERSKLIKHYVAFLNSLSQKADLQQELFGATLSLTRVATALPSSEKRALLDSLAATGNPTLALYVQLEKAIPRFGR